MAKYSYEFKLKIIKGYPGNSLGYKLLAKKYDIPNKSPIDRWVVHIKHAKKKLTNNIVINTKFFFSFFFTFFLFFLIVFHLGIRNALLIEE